MSERLLEISAADRNVNGGIFGSSGAFCYNMETMEEMSLSGGYVSPAAEGTTQDPARTAVWRPEISPKYIDVQPSQSTAIFELAVGWIRVEVSWEYKNPTKNMVQRRRENVNCLLRTSNHVFHMAKMLLELRRGDSKDIPEA